MIDEFEKVKAERYFNNLSDQTKFKVFLRALYGTSTDKAFIVNCIEDFHVMYKEIPKEDFEEWQIRGNQSL